MNLEPVLACNMSVFTPTQRVAHVENTTQLIQEMKQIRETANGYEFQFSNESELITKIAEFISSERLCCPFLKFILTVCSSSLISLSLTGPMGTQKFLRAEFEGAFA